MRTCVICGAEIPIMARATKYCSEACRKRAKYEINRAWLAKHPDKVLEYNKRWREANPDKARQYSRDSYQRKCLKKIEEEKG